MKSIVATIAALFAVSAFAQTPAAPAKKEEVKPAAAPAKPAASAPAKKEEKKVEAKPAQKKEEVKK